MDVRCDRCETEYELDDAIVTDAGASVQCTTCGHTFTVTRRSSAPSVERAVTPPAGLGQAVGPEVPEWTLSTEDGRIHRFRDLNTLQKWIVERKVSRTEKISRAGGAWLALGDVVELAPFFSVVDEADRARATGAPHPASPGRAVSSSSRPLQGAAPVSAGAQGQAPISQDGPTVPNRRLPGMSDPPPRPAPRPAPPPADARPPGPLAPDAVSSIIPAPGLRAPDRRPSSARRPVGQGPGPLAVPSATGITAPNVRTERSAAQVTEETRALEANFLRRGHGARNLVLGLVALGLGGGGYWWLTEPHDHASSVAVAPRNLAPGSVSATPPQVNAPRPTEAGGTAAPAASPKPRGETGAATGGANAKVAAAGSYATTPLATVAKGTPGGPGAGAARIHDAGPPAASGRGIPPEDVPPARGASGGSYARLVADADRLLERGKAARADKLYAQALAARPDGVEAITGSAYVLLDRQRHFKAIETFRRALAIEPGFGPALFGIAESYRARGDMAQALGAYRQYLATAPSGTDAPAARRQIKDLESAGSAAATERSAQDSASPSDDSNQ